MLGSIGVVYGDIGTSPLYAFREAVIAASGPSGTVSPLAVLGVLSLILWALILALCGGAVAGFGRGLPGTLRARVIAT